MFQRFGPLSRAGSLFNVLFTGGIVAFALVRFYGAGQPLPLYFPFVAILFVVFAVVALWAWWHYYNDTSMLDNADE